MIEYYLLNVSIKISLEKTIEWLLSFVEVYLNRHPSSLGLFVCHLTTYCVDNHFFLPRLGI